MAGTEKTNGQTNDTNNLPFKVLQCLRATVRYILFVSADNKQLNNPELLHQQSYVNGEWVESKSRARFNILGQPP